MSIYRKLCQKAHNLVYTAIVDDDYPRVQHEFGSAVASYNKLPTLPRVVCLCGSTRFLDAFKKAEFEETLKGRIVLTIGCDSKSDDELFHGEEGAETKKILDELHKRKIDLADEILVLNVDGYVGDSTRSEIEYAKSVGCPINYLEEYTNA